MAANEFCHVDMAGENVAGIDNWGAEKRYRTIARAFDSGAVLKADPIEFACSVLLGESGFTAIMTVERGKTQCGRSSTT